MRSQLSLPFNNQLSLFSLAITGKLQEGCQKAEQRLPIEQQTSVKTAMGERL